MYTLLLNQMKPFQSTQGFTGYIHFVNLVTLTLLSPGHQLFMNTYFSQILVCLLGFGITFSHIYSERESLGNMLTQRPGCAAYEFGADSTVSQGIEPPIFLSCLVTGELRSVINCWLLHLWSFLIPKE